MRYLFPVAALLMAAWSIFADVAHLPPGAGPCNAGLCRFDQIYSSVVSYGMSLTNEGAVLADDPSNPAVWSTYGELLAAEERNEDAQLAFRHAISLGPSMAPVLMRAANFDFSHGHVAPALVLSGRILRNTDEFNDLIFSYLTRPGIPSSDLLGTVIPPTRNKIRSWLVWLDKHGSDQDLIATWGRMKDQNLCDRESAIALTESLWERKSYRRAQQVWADWLQPQGGEDYPLSQLIANRFFQQEPSGSHFDWALMNSTPSATISGKNPVEIRFTGTENAEFEGLRQFTTVRAGRYRFSAEVSSQGLTTDQAPYFHIFSPFGPGVAGRAELASRDVRRSRIEADFQVPQNVVVLAIQIERHASQKFDNKIAGVLDVYAESLVRIP